MNLKNKKIGIWGFGVTGKSVLNFLQTLPASQEIGILEKKPLSQEDQRMLQEQRIALYTEFAPDDFLQKHDIIIPSPGIDLRPYFEYHHKMVCELDLFQSFWKKPIIAITGSVGKTTTTHLLSQILAAQKIRVATGGNIGIGSLDLIAQQEESDLALIEVSSFQLEYCTLFAPTIGLITNLYPNHLDRHGTFEQYVAAKMRMFNNQEDTQHVLIPWKLRSANFNHRNTHYLAKKMPSDAELLTLLPHEKIFTVTDETVVCFEKDHATPLLSLHTVPEISYLENVIALVAIMHLLKLDLNSLGAILCQQEIPEHRLEKVATIKEITFYNDSKATIPASTLAALEKLENNPIILFLGGISKGVDRSAFIKELSGKVKQVICFGKEAAQLKSWCDENNIPATSFENLESAFAHSLCAASAGDCILFSPAGASFDLFSDYKERGMVFKKMVKESARID